MRPELTPAGTQQMRNRLRLSTNFLNYSRPDITSLGKKNLKSAVSFCNAASCGPREDPSGTRCPTGSPIPSVPASSILPIHSARTLSGAYRRERRPTSSRKNSCQRHPHGAYFFRTPLIRYIWSSSWSKNSS